MSKPRKENDGRGKHPNSAIGREKGTNLRRRDPPLLYANPTPCYLAECWPEPREEHEPHSSDG